MKIAVLDKMTLGADITLESLERYGEVVAYPVTAGAKQTAERLENCEVAVLNKVKITEEVLKQTPSLRLICVAATGYDNIDLEACRARGVAVCNVPGYSTHSVAQVTVAMALSLMTSLSTYHRYVISGAYTENGVPNCLTPVYHELCGKTWGIVGLGNIGRQVARVAEAMGCRVIACKRTPDTEIPCVDLDTLCEQADIISLHVPLSDATRGCINEARLAKMKPHTILINVARGAVTDEEAVVRAVENGLIGGFGTDVYATEPLSADHPYRRLFGKENVLFTPHMAWGSWESRRRCLDEIGENIGAFYRDERRNRVES